MIKAIIFDFGNVIGYFDYRRTTRRLAHETGLPEDFWLKHVFAADLEDEYESGRITSADFLQRVRTAVALQLPDALLGEAYADIFTPNAEVCALVPQLKGRYRLLLGSNTNELHANHFRRQFADTLAHLDQLVLSHEVGARKPKAAFFQHCLKLADCAPNEAIFIDDLNRNVAGARAVGLHAVVYQGVVDLKQQLADLGVELS